MTEKANNIVRIGTRGSALALWQAEFVQAQLHKHFPTLRTELCVIKTTGDKILDAPLAHIGGKGIFTKELEQALLEHRIDLAVHSLKDVPTTLPEGLVIAAIPERTDAHDVFIPHPHHPELRIENVPQHGTIATGSLRRKSQLLAFRPDLCVVEIRGNLHTRLQKLEASQWNGMILAHAGLLRLGISQCVSHVLPFELFLPAVGQGALAIETRSDDSCTLDFVQPLHHEATSFAVRAERALLRTLEGGCQIPIGAYATVENGTLRLEACIGTVDGSQLIRRSICGTATEAEQLGTTLAHTLLSDGGRAILQSIHSSASQNIKEDDV